MAYSIEDQDIVMKGFEEGILDDPYNGIFDMRNVDIVTIPGEASIALKTTATSMTTPVTVTNQSVTVDTATNIFTWGGGTTLVSGMPIYFNTTQAGETVFGGMRTGGAYYVRQVLSPTTFTVSASIGGAELDVTADTSAIISSYASGQGNISSGSSLSIPMPAGLFPSYIGKIFVVMITNTTSLVTSGNTTLLAENSDANTARFCSLFYRVLRGDETSFDFNFAGAVTNGRYNYQILGNSSVYNAQNPIQVFSDTAYTTNDTALRASMVTTAVDHSLLFTFGWATGSRTFTKPVNIGPDAWSTISTPADGTYGSFYFGELFKTTAGATGNIDVTLDTPETIKHSFAFVINPIISNHVVFSSINMATPSSFSTGLTTNNEYIYFCVDINGRAWVYDTNNAYLTNTGKWLYMNNKVDNTTTTDTASVIVWKGYLFSIDTEGINYTQLAALTTMTGAWVYLWQPALTANPHKSVVSKDDRIFFGNGNHVGSLFQNGGFTFAPLDPTTYSYSTTALAILTEDRVTCLAELGSDLLIGGNNNLVYPWNMIDVGYGQIIRLSENYISRMVTVNTTTYIFAGHKGRIFMTNGGNATPYYKIPEYLSGTTNAYINWKDATFNNNQIYFSFSVTTNAGATIDQYGGVWALNVDTAKPSNPRLQNQLSYAAYTGYASCITQYRGLTFDANPSSDGYGLLVGWYSGSTSGIDIGSSTPYTNGEPYIIFDPIPVGTFKMKKTFQNLEYKLSIPLVSGESVSLYYRTNLTDAFTQVPITSGGATGDLSGLCDTVTFENSQWVQIKAVLNGTASSPSFVRLREVRLR